MMIDPTILQDTTGAATAYDSVWADPSVPTQAPTGIESVMLADDKLFVVLAVALIIWFGLIFFVVRTDNRLQMLERTLEADIPDPDERVT